MRNILLTLGLAACGGGEDAPSCQQATTHYYEAGCAITLQGGEITQGEAMGLCQDLIREAPPQCEDDVADFRSCMGGVPSPASGNADCDCSVEIDAILTCE